MNTARSIADPCRPKGGRSTWPVRQALHELVRALAVLALVFFTLSTASPGISSTSVVLREAGIVATLVTNLCGHDQPNIACHAPNSCCRPDRAILPPPPASVERAFLPIVRIAFGDAIMPVYRPVAHVSFRSRAPPFGRPGRA